MDLFCDQIDAAGRLGLDIVCLPEKFTKVGTTKNDAELAKPIPGPDTERLGAAAKRNHLWVVASLSELDGGRLFNTDVLLDRNGELKGKYRKVHLPLGEWKSGVVPGKEYPVFETDFGKVAHSGLLRLVLPGNCRYLGPQRRGDRLRAHLGDYLPR